MCQKEYDKAINSVQAEIVFIEETHSYYVDGKRLPSVSEIMKQMSKDYYADVDPDVLAIAAKRGTKVHEAVEVYERFELETEDEEIIPFVRNYKVAKKLEKFTVLENELRLATKDFAGTLDILGIHDQDMVVIDLKATSKINTDLLQVQLAAYRELAIVNGYDIKRVYVLHLTKKGYKFKEIIPNTLLWNEMKGRYNDLRSIDG